MLRHLCGHTNRSRHLVPFVRKFSKYEEDLILRVSDYNSQKSASAAAVSLLEIYKLAKLKKKEIVQDVSQLEWDFLKKFSETFNDEYFQKGTISGYINYSPNVILNNQRSDSLIENLHLKKGDKVLDVGCGYGYLVQSLIQRGIDAQGIDISDHAITVAKDASPSHSENFHLLKSPEILSLFPDKHFDVVILKDVLEHIPEFLLPNYIKTFERLGKRLLIITPIAKEDNKKYINSDDERDITHLIRWSRDTWINKLAVWCSVDPASIKEMTEINQTMKGVKSEGTFCYSIHLNETYAEPIRVSQTTSGETAPPTCGTESNKKLKIALFGTAMIRAEPIKKEDYFKGKIQKKFLQPPLGIYRLQHYIHAILPELISSNFIEIDVFDPALETALGGLDELFSKVRNGGYDIIGFSPIRVLMGEDLYFMTRVYEECVAANKNTLFLAGGNEASLNSTTLFETMPWLHFCVSGLGEPVFEMIVTRYLTNSELRNQLDSNSIEKRKLMSVAEIRSLFSDIAGLVYINQEGKLLENEIAKVDACKFRAFSAYWGSNIPYERYWEHNQSLGPVDTNFSGTTIKTIRLFTRNFCPYKCSFCSHQTFGRRVFENAESLTPEQIGELIMDSVKLKGAEGIYFNDDEMFGNSKNAVEILEHLISLKKEKKIPKNLRFYGQTRVDKVNLQILKLMKEVGFAFLSFGVESFSNESLKAIDLKKGFNEEQAEVSVRTAMKAGMPITNINLILLHPTITKSSLIRTIEKSIELLHESIEHSVRLSVNSFPLIEAYAGAPINQLADKKKWPRTVSSIQHGDKKWSYTVNYLPINEELRKLVIDVQYSDTGESLPKQPNEIIIDSDDHGNYTFVENEEVQVAENASNSGNGRKYTIVIDKWLTEFDKIMEEITTDPRWPSVPVSRSIGINGLVSFIALYNCLQVTTEQSKYTVQNMYNLIWDLIKKYNPSIELSCNYLLNEKANILFADAECRAGNMKIENLPNEIVDKLWKSCSNQPILFSTRNIEPIQLKNATENCFYAEKEISFYECLKNEGVPVYNSKEMIKTLLIHPYGNYDGTPLKTIVPHPGIQRIHHRLLQFPSIQSLVFNPNLYEVKLKMENQLEEKYNFTFLNKVEKDGFDIIAFSFIPIIMKNDAPIIDSLAHQYPNAIIVAGGLNIDRLPFARLFHETPFDVFLGSSGELEMLDFLSLLPFERRNLSKKQLLNHLRQTVHEKQIPNIYIRDTTTEYKNDGNEQLKEDENIINKNYESENKKYLQEITEEEVRKGINYDRPDILHGVSYNEIDKQLKDGKEILSYDMIGNRRFYIKISDNCKARCVFCSAPFVKLVPEKLENIVKEIEKNYKHYDSIHFADNDLLYDRSIITQLCNLIIAHPNPDVVAVPKVGKSRTDEVDDEILSLLKRAGFSIITFGVESFDDKILRKMWKQNTSENNRTAIDLTLKHGIKPGMDMIFFSPWETLKTFHNSLNETVHFVEKGAYVNLVPEVHVHLGDHLYNSRYPIEYQEIQFPFTNKVFYNPKRAKIIEVSTEPTSTPVYKQPIVVNEALEAFRKSVLARKFEWEGCPIISAFDLANTNPAEEKALPNWWHDMVKEKNIEPLGKKWGLLINPAIIPSLPKNIYLRNFKSFSVSSMLFIKSSYMELETSGESISLEITTNILASIFDRLLDSEITPN